MKKKKLRLQRVTLQQLSPAKAATVRAGIDASISCHFCPPPPSPTKQHSCFDSCYYTDCCLMVP